MLLLFSTVAVASAAAVAATVADVAAVVVDAKFETLFP